MSENPTPNPPIDPTLPPAAPVPPKRKRRWRRRIVLGLLALPVFAAVGALLLPTILSLGPVRSLAMSYASPAVAPNGSLTIDSWSFGWLGGQKINGITLFDDQHAAVAHLNVETGATLLGLARGDYDLKHTTVTGDFDVRIDPATGRVNVLHVLGADAEPAPATKPKDEKPKDGPKPAGEPTKVPDVKGTVHVAMHGTVSSTNANDSRIPLTNVERADLDVDLSDLDKGVGLNGTIRATIAGKPASIVVTGSADAIENHVVVTDLDKIGAKLDIAIEQLDLAVVKIALAASASASGTTPPEIDVAGLLKGKIAVNVVPGGAATIASDALGIDDLKLAAPQLKGDTVALKRLDLPLNVTRDATTKLYTIASTGIRSDLATVDVAGTLPEAVVQNFIDKKAPGSTGQIVVTTSVPSFAAVLKMLPNTIPPQPGVTVTGGSLADTLTVNLVADGAKVDTALKFDVKGTSDGKPIAIDATSVAASADYAIRYIQPDPAVAPTIDGNLRNVRAISLDLAAPFATVKGGGVPTKMQLDGNLDLTKLFAEATQFVDLEELFKKNSPQLVGLKLNGQSTFSLSTDGDPTDLAKPIAAKLSFETTGLTAVTKTKSYLDNEGLKGDVDLLFRQADHAKIVTFNKLAVSSSSSLIGLWTAGDAAWVSIPDTDANGKPLGAYGGRGEFHFRTTKLDRLVAMAGPPADPSTQVTRGVVDSIITLASDATGANYTIATTTDVTKLDVGKLLGNETISITSNTSLPASVATAKSTFDVASKFANVKGDADLLLADGDKTPTAFAMVRSANFAGDVPSLAKLYGLKESISPSKPVLDTTTGKPLPPMRVDAGSLAFTGKVTRDDAKNLTNVRLDVPAIKDLKLARGDATFSPAQPITLAITSDLTTNNNAPNADKTKATILDNLDRAIATIDLNAPGLATVKTTTPIDVAGFKQTTPSAKGVVHATASLGSVFQMLTVVSGSPPKAIAGDFASDQTLATAGNAIRLTGTGQITKLTPTGPDAKPLPTQLQTIDLADDVSLDLSDANAMALSIAKVDAYAPEARDALSLNVVGKVGELGTNNAIDSLVAKVKYDLPQLWPVIRPVVDPTGTSIGKVDDLAGKYEKTFTVSGSYPTAKADGTLIPFNESIKTLVVAGDVQLDKANLSEKGVEVANVSLPISLKDGVARVAFADGTPPKPMTLNNGTADLGGLSVNLAGAEPILGDVKNKQLVKGATLNPLLSNALGKFFNPIFPNATKASANIDVVLTSTGLHLGPSLTTKNSGKAVVVLSLTNLDIRNPLSDELLGKLVNGVSSGLKLGDGVDTKSLTDLSGQMKDATFTLDRGVVTQDATFMLGNKGAVDDKGQPKLYAFKFAGDVRLDTLGMNLTAGFPLALLKDKLKGDAGEILAFAPDNFDLGLTGTTTAPKADLNGLSKMFAEAFTKYGTSKLIKGGKDDKPALNADGTPRKKTDADKINDIIGGILGEKKPDAADPNDPKKQADPGDDAPAKKKKKKKSNDDNN